MLVHNKDCDCHSELKHMNDDFSLEATSTSNSDYNVIFNNIPSGHSYKLYEKSTDEYHEINTKEYNVIVSYGKTTVEDFSNTVINNYKTKDLTILKKVEGVKSTKSFAFTIEATYQNEPLTGTYNVIKNDTVNDTITFTDGKATFTLKNDDKIKILELPYKIEFTIKENNNEGFVVKYQINDGIIQFYKDKDLNKNNLENNMKITFINASGYELPATGSSGMLILTIIGSLLVIMPVLYISINAFKKADN